MVEALNAAPALSVAVFAHNEEEGLPKCLAAIDEAASRPPEETAIHVLANGCRDNTAEVAREYAQRRGNMAVHELDLGDKANAWNRYVHDFAPEAPFHAFVDGDTRPQPGSLRCLREALEADPYANAASGIPEGGRTSRRWARNILTNHGMPGPLYMIRGAVLDRIREKGVRLPFGLRGDDVVVPLLVKTDLLAKKAIDRERVRPCREARFRYSSLSLTKPGHWRVYGNRLFRRSLRFYQNQLLLPRLRREGIPAIPENMEDFLLESDLSGLHPRRSPGQFLFDWLTLRRLRRRQAVRWGGEGKQA